MLTHQAGPELLPVWVGNVELAVVAPNAHINAGYSLEQRLHLLRAVVSWQRRLRARSAVAVKLEHFFPLRHRLTAQFTLAHLLPFLPANSALGFSALRNLAASFATHVRTRSGVTSLKSSHSLSVIFTALGFRTSPARALRPWPLPGPPRLVSVVTCTPGRRNSCISILRLFRAFHRSRRSFMSTCRRPFRN